MSSEGSYEYPPRNDPNEEDQETDTLLFAIGWILLGTTVVSAVVLIRYLWLLCFKTSVHSTRTSSHVSGVEESETEEADASLQEEIPTLVRCVNNEQQKTKQFTRHKNLWTQEQEFDVVPEHAKPVHLFFTRMTNFSFGRLGNEPSSVGRAAETDEKGHSFSIANNIGADKSPQQYADLEAPTKIHQKDPIKTVKTSRSTESKSRLLTSLHPKRLPTEGQTKAAKSTLTTKISKRLDPVFILPSRPWKDWKFLFTTPITGPNNELETSDKLHIQNTADVPNTIDDKPKGGKVRQATRNTTKQTEYFRPVVQRESNVQRFQDQEKHSYTVSSREMSHSLEQAKQTLIRSKSTGLLPLPGRHTAFERWQSPTRGSTNDAHINMATRGSATVQKERRSKKGNVAATNHATSSDKSGKHEPNVREVRARSLSPIRGKRVEANILTGEKLEQKYYSAAPSSNENFSGTTPKSPKKTATKQVPKCVSSGTCEKSLKPQAQQTHTYPSLKATPWSFSPSTGREKDRMGVEISKTLDTTNDGGDHLSKQLECSTSTPHGVESNRKPKHLASCTETLTNQCPPSVVDAISIETPSSLDMTHPGRKKSSTKKKLSAINKPTKKVERTMDEDKKQKSDEKIRKSASSKKKRITDTSPQIIILQQSCLPEEVSQVTGVFCGESDESHKGDDQNFGEAMVEFAGKQLVHNRSKTAKSLKQDTSPNHSHDKSDERLKPLRKVKIPKSSSGCHRAHVPIHSVSLDLEELHQDDHSIVSSISDFVSYQNEDP
jgi:hypothetical protein